MYRQLCERIRECPKNGWVSEVPSYTLKWHRAADLFKIIDEHSADFVESKITYSADPRVIGTDEWDILTWDEPPEPDPLLGVIVGELIHDVRSGLDHLVRELVLENGGDPGEHSQFPIYDSETKWIQDVEDRDPTKKPSPIEGVADKVFEYIKEVQPYHLRHKQRPGHPLMQLLRMSNVDKHRTLHVVSVSAHAPHTARYEPAGYVTAMKTRFVKPGVLVQSGTELGRIRRRIIKMPPPGVEVIVRVVGKAEFAFGVRGKPPIATLTDLSGILSFTRDIILQLRPSADLSVVGDPPLESPLQRESSD